MGYTAFGRALSFSSTYVWYFAAWQIYTQTVLLEETPEENQKRCGTNA